jgi:predicted aldo/keto reductase-like oxidoreductase
MKYRKMPKIGEEISILGFGCMRFPLREDGSIYEELSERMMDYAIERGVNYIDTAWPYHEGESEPFVGRFLEKYGHRDRVNLATKLPSWLIEKREDMDYYLDEQLKRLRTNHIDYYLVHALNKNRWEQLKKCGIFDFLSAVKEDGRVRNVGFSFHDDLSTFKEIVDSYNWNFCQIQYNYMDTEFQAGKKGLLYAAEKGLGVIVMEPLRGGKIAGRIPPEVQRLLDSQKKDYSPVEWALRWVWDHPQVTLLLSGMTALEHVVENAEVASKAESSSLTEKEKSVIKEIRDIYRTRMKILCTDCKYCLPCPAGVNIPRVFQLYNDAFIFDDMEAARRDYNMFLKEDEKAHNCIECGKCENLCPQKISIIEKLAQAVKAFEE